MVVVGGLLRRVLLFFVLFLGVSVMFYFFGSRGLGYVLG